MSEVPLYVITALKRARTTHLNVVNEEPGCVDTALGIRA